jgi:hypothetical protein
MNGEFMSADRNRRAQTRLHKVTFLKLSAIALICAAAAVGTAGHAFAATTTDGGYGPPPVTTPAPPGGFTTVVTTVTSRPAGGTVGAVPVDGAELTVTIPPGAFPTSVQITVTAPDLADITPLPGFINVTGVGVEVTLNGSPYPGTFLKPITATLRSSRITASSDVLVWNGTSFVTDPDSAATSGEASVSFDTDPDFAVASPVSTKPTVVPGATTPVTGEPLLGEGLLAGVLVLAGTGGFVASRRRRAGAHVRRTRSN